MKGYYHNEEATAEALKDGWLHTGDLGFLDADGFLGVVGREKALLIADDGEKYSPEEIEEAILSASPLVSQVMLYNDHRRYTSALVVLDVEQARRLLKSGKARTPAELLEEVRRSFFLFREDPRNAGRFPGRWIPHTFQILPEPFSEGNGMINSSLKMVRYRIVEAHGGAAGVQLHRRGGGGGQPAQPAGPWPACSTWRKNRAAQTPARSSADATTVEVG